MLGSKSNKAATATLIAKGTTVRGEIEIESDLHVDGTLEGTVSVKGDVSVGPDGKILGTLKAKNLTVGGRVDGTVTVEGLLRVLNGGRVGDDVRYDALEVQNGGVIEGRSGRIGQESDKGAVAGDKPSKDRTVGQA